MKRLQDTQNQFLSSPLTLSTKPLKEYSFGGSWRWKIKSSTEITQLHPIAWLVVTCCAHAHEGPPRYIMAVSKEVIIVSWQLSQEASTTTITASFLFFFFPPSESHRLPSYLGKTVKCNQQCWEVDFVSLERKRSLFSTRLIMSFHFISYTVISFPVSYE